MLLYDDGRNIVIITVPGLVTFGRAYHAVLLLRFQLGFRHAVQGGRLDRVRRDHRLVARRGRGLEHRQTVRHADAGPADRRGRVAEPRVRLLAQG